MEYRVIWTIDLDADSPEDAACKALAIHRDPDSIATHFEVRDPEGQTEEVNLEYPCKSPLNNVYVLVPMEEGIVRDVQAFQSKEAAERDEEDWLATKGLTGDRERNDASDWGTGIAVWECRMEA